MTPRFNKGLISRPYRINMSNFITVKILQQFNLYISKLSSSLEAYKLSDGQGIPYVLTSITVTINQKVP